MFCESGTFCFAVYTPYLFLLKGKNFTIPSQQGYQKSYTNDSFQTVHLFDDGKYQDFLDWFCPIIFLQSPTQSFKEQSAYADIASRRTASFQLSLPQHFLYFFPLPQGQGSFRPIFVPENVS